MSCKTILVHQYIWDLFDITLVINSQIACLMEWPHIQTKCVTVGRAQTGLQNCDLGIIQHSKVPFLCWIILKSQFCWPVWARQTVTHFV